MARPTIEVQKHEKHSIVLLNSFLGKILLIGLITVDTRHELRLQLVARYRNVLQSSGLIRK